MQRNIARFIKERRTIKAVHLFRGYSALVVVICSALLVSATNFAAGKESNGFLFGYFGGGDDYDSPVANNMAVQTQGKKNDLALVELAEASTAPDPNASDKSNPNNSNSGGPINLQGQALVASTSPVRQDPEEDGGVVIYTVKEGDTISSIAASHNITVNTILWANALDDVNSIKPGDKIFILPTDGVSYTVQSGDNINYIAQKFKADKNKIISFNSLPATGELTKGETIIIPDGQKEMQQQSSVSTIASVAGIAARQYAPFTSGKTVTTADAGLGHQFPRGYCTWWVAENRYIPWSGNAGTWLFHAKSMGYATGRTPRAGAIMVSDVYPYGHVALVRSVSGSTFQVSEMNFDAFNHVDYRDVSIHDSSIIGFIY